MKNVVYLVSILFYFNSCSYKFAEPLSKDFLSNTDSIGIKEAKSIKTSLEKIVNAGGNIKRQKSVIKLANDLSLKENTTTQWIDWFSFQKNILIEIKGRSDSIVYVTAHTDKTDINPLKFVSILLNGLFDEAISWTYFSDGAVDNASGVSVALEVAKKIKQEKLYYTYRFLFTGSEESGLRGSRLHVARLPDSIWGKIKYSINIDCIGTKDGNLAAMNIFTDTTLYIIAKNQAIKNSDSIKWSKTPLLAGGDCEPFLQNGFLNDFTKGLSFNLVGGLLPQRSHFAKKKKSIPSIFFSTTNIIDGGDYVSGIIPVIGFGKIHGFRDNIKRIDINKLYANFDIIYKMIQAIDTGNTYLHTSYDKSGIMKRDKTMLINNTLLLGSILLLSL